jgi:glycosyltransferase involved in cell wall biosynthesis
VQPDVVHGHSSVGGALARLVSIGRSIPVVYTPNGLARGRSARTIERLLARRTSRFVAVSSSEGDLAVDLGLTTRDRLVVIPNGIDLESPPRPTGHELRAALGIPRDAFVIGTVSRLVAQKAPEVFTRAARLAAEHDAEAHVVLIGSGPLADEVRREGAELGDRFHLVEQLDDAAAALNGLDVFVLASRFEGGPYTPLEAMRAGVPVILTDVVGNRDAVEHERTGLLVPADDTTALRAAILRYRHDLALRDRMVAGARQALSRFDVGQMGAATSRMYLDVAHGPRAGLLPKMDEPK